MYGFTIEASKVRFSPAAPTVPPPMGIGRSGLVAIISEIDGCGMLVVCYVTVFMHLKSQMMLTGDNPKYLQARTPMTRLNCTVLLLEIRSLTHDQ